MSEKMKCAHCGKRFKQTNKKQVLCADCLAKERMAKRSAPSSDMASRASAGAQASAITIVQTTPPPAEAIFGSQARIAERRVAHTQAHAIEQRPPHSAASAPPAQHATVTPPPPAKARASQHPARNTAQTEKHVRPHRQKLAPFEMTDEMRATIERRYLELSQPVEFDGIRTRIATELNLPKPVVKQVVRELRAKRQLPSWWELQAYKGNEDTLERVRERYLPLLPVPPIGVHKQIAIDLQLDAPQVYQAIRRLRAEMKLPQYNPPESHADETSPAAVAEIGASPSSPE